MSLVKTLSFGEIVKGRDASVRITDDGWLYVMDLIMVMTGLSRDDAGKTLRRLFDKNSQSDKMSDKMPDWNSKIIERQFSNRGGYPTKLIGFQDALELIMVLPGKVAKETRTHFSDIIKRYLGGDRSLLGEIENNAESNSPIAQLARGTLIDQDPEDGDTRRKRLRKEELEIASLEEEIQAKRIKNAQSFMSLMTTIRPDWMETDARFRLQTEDMIKNILVQPVSDRLMITQGEGGGAEKTTQSLSISQLAKELGCKPLSHAQSCTVGKLAAKRYREKHGEEPPVHRQWVDGAERSVKSYTEEDREMLTEVLVDLGLTPEI